MKVQMAAYESKCGFFRDDLPPGVRGRMVLCMRFFIGGSVCFPRTAILGINVLKGMNRGEVNDSLSTPGDALEVFCFSCAVEGVSSSFIKRQMISIN